MQEIEKLDLSSLIVSIAEAVVDANRILSEGTEAPMGISEFTITYQVHASLNVQDAAPGSIGLVHTAAGTPVLSKPRVQPAQLLHFTTMTPRERILTAYLRDADLTITSKFEPLPRTE